MNAISLRDSRRRPPCLSLPLGLVLVFLGPAVAWAQLAVTSGTYSNDITGATSLQKTSPGTWIYLGTATHTGGTTVSEGRLDIGDRNDPNTTGFIAGDIAVESGAIIDFNRRDGMTYAGSISGAGQVLKEVPGDLILTGTNTFSGGLGVYAGRVVAAAENTLSPNSVHYVYAGATLQLQASQVVPFLGGDGNVDLSCGSVLTFSATHPIMVGVNFGGNIRGDGSLVKTGAGMQSLTGNNTYSGGTTIKQGHLQIGLNTPYPNGSIVGNVTVDAGAYLDFARLNSYTFNGSVSGAGNLQQVGSGTLTLVGNNTHSGSTNIGVVGRAGATLVAGEANTLSANSVHQLAAGSVLQLDYDQTIKALAGSGTVNLATGAGLTINNSEGQTFSGTIQGGGSLVKSGTGTQILSGDNTFTGMTTVTGGTLQLGSSGTSGSVAGTVTTSGTGALTVNRSNTLSLDVNTSGTGNFLKLGAGTLTLTGAMSHSGVTSVSAGTLVIGAANVLSPNSALTLNGGALQLAHGQTIKNLSSSATGNLTLGEGVVLTTTAGGTFQGTASGTGGLSVTGGIFRVGASGLASNTTNAFNVAATVGNTGELSGNGQFGAVTVDANGRLGAGFAGIGTLTTGDLTWNSGGILRFQINDATGTAGQLAGWDLLIVSGGLTINASSAAPFIVTMESLTAAQAPGAVANFDANTFYSWNVVATTDGITGFDPAAFVFDFDGIAGHPLASFTDPPAGTFAFSQSGNSILLNYTPAAIPEPATCAVFAGLGVLVIAVWRRGGSGRRD